MLRFFLISIYIALLASAASARTCADSTKSAGSTMKCPAPYKCIEVKIAQGLLLESIPLDQPIMLYAANSEGIESGSFTVWQIPTKGSPEEIVSGPLLVDSKENMIYAVINRFLKANRTYRFDFHTSVPARTKQQLHKIIVESFLNIQRNLLAGGTLSVGELNSLRASLLARIPTNTATLIAAGSFLDKNSLYALTDADMIYMDQLYHADKSIQEFDELVGQLESNLETFLSASNISVIKNKNGDKMASNLQSINEEAKRIEILSGRANFKNPSDLLPTIDLYAMKDFNPSAFVKNIDTNIALLESWEKEALIDQTGLREVIQGLLHVKQKLEVHFFNNEIFIDGEMKALASTLVKSVITSFEGTSFGDFQQSARWYVGADIGAVATNFNGESDGWYVLPYAGLNLSFVPVNKESSLTALFRDYKWKAIWKLLSFNAGVTLTKINSEKYQGIYDFENQRALISGVGLRPWRGVKLGYGGIFINHRIGNDLNPSSRSISVKQYFSISLDWDLRKIIPDVKNIFSN